MGMLFGSKPKTPSEETLLAEAERLRGELEAARTAVADTQELARHLDAERDILLRAVEALSPTKTPKELAESLLELTFKPLDLCIFYVATVDLRRDQLVWVAYHEGGRLRVRAPRSFSQEGGLTAQAIRSCQPIYVETTDQGLQSGAVLSEAEKVSGLVAQSWYGVPLGWGERRFGLVSFQSFQPRAFSPSRRAFFDALGALLARAMVLSDPSLHEGA
jgi:GAF domain-containing protein